MVGKKRSPATTARVKKKSSTYCLFFPSDYKETFLKIFGNSPAFSTKKVMPRLRSIVEKQFLTIKSAKIRKKSGKPGEVRWIPIDHIASFTIIDKPMAQKRWYKTIVCFSQEGIKKGQPQVSTIFIYFSPAVLNGLIDRYKKRN